MSRTWLQPMSSGQALRKLESELHMAEKLVMQGRHLLTS